MQNPVPDERYSVADEAILGAFFKLVKKKTTDQITVSDITKTAGIARSTFYNHYQDIPSLLEEVVTEDTERAIRSCKNLSSLEECLRSITAHILENRRAILHIYRSMSRDSYEKGLLRLCDTVARLYIGAQVGAREIALQDRAILIGIYRSELFGLLLHWLMEGLKTDIDPLICRACYLCEKSAEEMLGRCQME